MTTWKFTAHSSRTTAPVKGKIELVVEAETREDAEALVRDSLPGFDWAQWESLFGPVEVAA